MKKYTVRITCTDPDDTCIIEVSHDELGDALGDVLRAYGYGRPVGLMGQVLDRMGLLSKLDEWEKRAKKRWTGADKDLGESAECQKLIDDFELPFLKAALAMVNAWREHDEKRDAK